MVLIAFDNVARFTAVGELDAGAVEVAAPLAYSGVVGAVVAAPFETGDTEIGAALVAGGTLAPEPDAPAEAGDPNNTAAYVVSLFREARNRMNANARAPVIRVELFT